jgi:hypothetical protein
MPFQKGQSGNPGGRAKENPAFKARCRAAVDAECVQRWIDEVRDGGEQWVKCSELLAAYGYGKPSQTLEIDGTVKHEHSGLDGHRRAVVLDAIRALGTSETTH